MFNAYGEAYRIGMYAAGRQFLVVELGVSGGSRVNGKRFDISNVGQK